MTAVVQAVCPGCKKTLRIPADWVRQAIRCKFCGLVMQAKQRPPVAPGRPTPPPPSRNAQAAPLGPGTPPPLPVLPPSPAIRQAPAVTVAPPVPAAPIVPDDPFAAFAHPDDGPAPRRRHRGSGWKGPVIFVGILLVAAGVGYVNRERFAALFPSDKSAEKKDDKGASNNPTGPRDDAGKPRDDKPADPPRPKDGDKPKDDSKPKDNTRPTEPSGSPYPRRALIVSVNNGLYSNPIQYGPPDLKLGHNLGGLRDALSTGLHVPMTQSAILSDAAGKNARAPLRPVIEATLTSFLSGSRSQDRILVFFVCHSVEVEGKVYLVPLEGEMDNVATLIPLEWVYNQLAACKARQKILVLDINRFSPTNGLLRPSSGKMTEKTEAVLKNPPPGVQVWSACSKDQESYETDDHPIGAFLDHFWTILFEDKAKGGLKGLLTLPKATDSIPLDTLNRLTAASLKKEMDKRKLAQTPFVAGKEIDGGAPYDPKEKMPDSPVVANIATLTGGQANVDMVRAVLDEVGAPPVKASLEDVRVKYDLLPPFSQRAMENYVAARDKDSAFQRAIHRARVALWAVSPEPSPPELKGDIATVKEDIKDVNLSVLKEGYRKPANETRFKAMVFNDEKRVADLLLVLDEALKEMQKVGKERDGQPKRWQANYDFMLARLQRQIAYLYEYQSMLGQMRKELPKLEEDQGGWRLAAQATLTGDSVGRKLATSSLKTLDKIIQENAGTPWEVLAKREKLTALGLEWKGAR